MRQCKTTTGSTCESKLLVYNSNSRLAALYGESVSHRKVPVETRKPTHASANNSCEFATNMARDRTMLAKERTVTHKKSEKTLEEVGSSAVVEGSAKYSFQRSKRKANATNAMPQIVPIVSIIAERSAASFDVSSVSCLPPSSLGRVLADLNVLFVRMSKGLVRGQNYHWSSGSFLSCGMRLSGHMKIPSPGLWFLRRVGSVLRHLQ